MLIINDKVCQFKRISLRLLTSGMLAAIGLINGLIPEIALQQLQPRFVASAYAQNPASPDFTSEEVVSYAKAGFEVELLRQQVYKKIKSLINEPPPDIVCNQPETLARLDDEVRDIAANYCEESQRIVTDNNLTIARFNELKNFYDRGGDFYERVQDVLINLQN